MLRYEHIEYLNLLFIIPLLLIAIVIFGNWRKKALESFGDNELVNRLMITFSKKRKNIKNLLFILMLIFLIIGISNPQIGTKIEEVKREGVDLIIAIDLSNSMMAEDIKPNRLDRAKQAISKLIEQLKGDRIGLVVFAGEAYVQLPITTDYSAANLFLSSINSSIVPTQGTEISKAIDLSIESFDMENGQNKAIIIITDGENHDEKAIESAKKSNELGIIIHTLGMGLSKGGPIPIYNNYGTQNGFRKDREGNTIVSKLNENLLIQIANAGKGKYIRANNSKAGLSTLFTEINKMEKKEIGTMIFTEHKDRFQLFLIITLVLLIFDLFLLERKNNWKKIINYRKK